MLSYGKYDQPIRSIYRTVEFFNVAFWAGVYIVSQKFNVQSLNAVANWHLDNHPDYLPPEL